MMAQLQINNYHPLSLPSQGSLNRGTSKTHSSPPIHSALQISATAILRQRNLAPADYKIILLIACWMGTAFQDIKSHFGFLVRGEDQCNRGMTSLSREPTYSINK